MLRSLACVALAIASAILFATPAQADNPFAEKPDSKLSCHTVIRPWAGPWEICGNLAQADESATPQHCGPLSIPKAVIERSAGGSWKRLPADQWQFLRGIFVMNPLTPPGLPLGDGAAIARIDGDDGALIFFLDGDQACGAMPVPKELLEMLRDISTGKVHHEGDAS